MGLFDFFKTNKRKKARVLGKDIWLIEDLMNVEECTALINRIENSGYKMARQYKEGRHNKEAFADEKEVATMLLQRLAGYELATVGKVYRMAEFSFPLEFYKYEEGDFIKRHSDAKREIYPGQFSSHTMVLYLNDDCEGGETLFNDNGLKVNPKKGNAVFFMQELHHEAMVVKKGKKYILRTNCLTELA